MMHVAFALWFCVACLDVCSQEGRRWTAQAYDENVSRVALLPDLQCRLPLWVSRRYVAICAVYRSAICCLTSAPYSHARPLNSPAVNITWNQSSSLGPVAAVTSIFVYDMAATEYSDYKRKVYVTRPSNSFIYILQWQLWKEAVPARRRGCQRIIFPPELSVISTGRISHIRLVHCAVQCI